MKLKGFAEEQINGILKQEHSGIEIVDLSRIHGIGNPTFCAWSTKCGGHGSIRSKEP